MTLKLQLPILLCLAAFIACSGQHLKDPDGDGERNAARPFSKLGPTEDRLNPRLGDREDWRFVNPDHAGQMEMRISVGKWEESTLSGHVTIYTEVGDRIAEKALPTGSGTLKFRFAVENNMRYLVRFRATGGKGQYAVEVDWGSDPCANCAAGEECRDNRCVKTSGPVRRNKCAGVKCPHGQRCGSSTGRCFVPRPKCASGQTYRGGKCVTRLKDIVMRIIDARQSGAGSLLTLSSGADKDVKKGARGSVKGLRGSAFVVTEVYPSRSKAKCKQPPGKVIGHPVAVIKR